MQCGKSRWPWRLDITVLAPGIPSRTTARAAATGRRSGSRHGAGTISTATCARVAATTSDGARAIGAATDARRTANARVRSLATARAAASTVTGKKRLVINKTRAHEPCR